MKPGQHVYLQHVARFPIGNAPGASWYVWCRLAMSPRPGEVVVLAFFKSFN